MAIDLQDSKRAAEFFKLPAARAPGSALTTGYDTINTPRFKFMWFVSFFLETQPGSTVGRADISFEAKTVDKPKVNFQTETLNQYNKKRLIHTRVEYQPISVRFHDTVSDKVLSLWHNYAAFYNNDFSFQKDHPDWNYDIISNDFQIGKDGWGFNIKNKLNSGSSNFFNRIEIYNVFGGEYSQITLVRPKIQSFDPDTLDYSAGGDIQEIGITFSYEGIIYKKRTVLSKDLIETFNLQIVRADGKGALPEPGKEEISKQKDAEIQNEATKNAAKGVNLNNNLLKNPLSYLKEKGQEAVNAAQNIASNVVNTATSVANNPNIEKALQLVNIAKEILDTKATTPTDIEQKVNDIKNVTSAIRTTVNDAANNTSNTTTAVVGDTTITVNKTPDGTTITSTRSNPREFNLSLQNLGDKALIAGVDPYAAKALSVLAHGYNSTTEAALKDLEDFVKYASYSFKPDLTDGDGIRDELNKLTNTMFFNEFPREYKEWVELGRTKYTTLELEDKDKTLFFYGTTVEVIKKDEESKWLADKKEFLQYVSDNNVKNATYSNFINWRKEKNKPPAPASQPGATGSSAPLSNASSNQINNRLNNIDNKTNAASDRLSRF